MRYAFIETHSAHFSISALCRTLQVSRSGFYEWKGRGECQRRRDDVRLLANIKAIHVEHRNVYGAVKTWRALNQRGIRCGKHRVARLRRQARIESLRRRAYRFMAGRPRRGVGAPHLVKRCFTARAPDRVWVGDMTFVRTVGGWLHLAVLLDLFSRKVVGWAMGPAANEQLAIAALEMALAHRRPGPGLIHHTDQGTPYTSDNYRAQLLREGLRASNGAAGDCYDNAAAESFFSTLKTELVHHYRFERPEQARAAIFEYVEMFYNRKRIHQALNYRSPAEAENDAVPTCP